MLDSRNEPLPTDLATVAETARALGCSNQAIHNWVRNGIVRGWRVGRRVKVSLAECKAYLTPVPIKPTAKEETVRTAAQEKRDSDAATRRLRAKGY